MNKGSIDTTLVIRAKDEASKALAAIEGAVSGLLDTQKQVAAGSQSAASGIGQTVSALAGLDRAYSQISGAADKGAAAFQRQLGALASNQAQLKSLQTQLDAARAAQERMNTAGAKFVGPPTRDAVARYQGVTAEITNLESSIKGLQRTVAQQEAGFTRSASSLAELGRQTRLAGAATTFAKQENEAYTRSLQQQEAAAARVAQLRAAIERSTDATTGKSAAESAAAFRSAGLTSFEKSQAAAADELATKAARLRAELNPTAVIQKRLNRELAQLPAVAKAAGFSAQELAQAEALLRKRADEAAQAITRQKAAGAGGLGFLGLRPHELQILGYQVNDIVTQLASGTSLTQTLAQQGGQIVQIFPRAGKAIVGALSNPAILGAVAVVGAFVTGLKKAGDEADRLRGFVALLASTADGSTYGADELSAATQALDAYGLSAKDAVAAVRTFVKEGVASDRLQEFGQAASDLAEVTGTDLKEAVDKVSEGFTGGYDAVKKLDDAYGFLTAAQRDQIRTLFEEGRAAEARSRAFAIFNDKMSDAAEKMRGPWADAARELGTAWQEFTHWLADTGPIQEVSGALDTLGRNAALVIRKLRGASTESDLLREIAGAQANIDFYQAAQARGNKAVGNFLKLEQARLGALKGQLETVREAASAEKNRGDTIAQNKELQGKQTGELKRQIAEEKKSKTVAEEVAEARRKATDYLDREFASADAATRQAYINQKVTEAREAAQKRIADQAKREADERKRAADEAKRLAQQVKFIDPVSGQVTSGFGLRTAPKAGASTFHKGIDIAAPIRTPVVAPAGGVIIETGTDSKLGKFVFIDHGRNTVSKFGHLSDNSQVKTGQIVTQGQTIGRTGNTGNVTGPHLHYQVEVNGKPVDPRKGIFVEDGLGHFKTDIADAVADYDKIVEKQDDFLAGLDRAYVERERETKLLREQSGLQGAALQSAQKEAEIENAVAKAREDAAKVGIAANDPALELRLQKLREITGAYFDASHARDTFDDQRAAVDQPVQDLTALRDGLQDRIRFLQETGKPGLANQLEPQLQAVNSALLQAIANAHQFYTTLTDNPDAMAALGLTSAQIGTIKLGLEAAALAGQNFGYIMGVSGETITQMFASTATNAFDQFAKSVAQGASVFKSLGQAFRQFAADFLRQIAQMILQQALFNAISGTIGGGIGGGKILPSSGGSILNAHGGAVVGDPATYNRPGTFIRAADPAWFTNAWRYHTGGIAGLAPNEVPAILKRGEEVLTAQDPRHVANGGGSAAVAPKVTVINTLDPSEFLSKALGTPVGDKTVLNWMRANQSAVRGALGS